MSEPSANPEPRASRRRATDRTPDRLIFLTDTGKRLCCSVAPVGTAHERHWMIVDPDGALYVGPTASDATSSPSALDLVAEWWTQQSLPRAAPPRAD